jgi:tyrosyl-tRNA synthetase
MERVPLIEVARKILQENIDLISLLADTKIFSSKGEARKMLAGGGVFLNKEKVTDVDTKVNEDILLNKKYLLVQKGKKNYYLLKTI